MSGAGDTTPSSEVADFLVATTEEITTSEACLIFVLPAVLNESTGNLSPAVGRKITFSQLAGMTAPYVSPLVLPSLDFSDPRNSALF